MGLIFSNLTDRRGRPGLRMFPTFPGTAKPVFYTFTGNKGILKVSTLSDIEYPFFFHLLDKHPEKNRTRDFSIAEPCRLCGRMILLPSPVNLSSLLLCYVGSALYNF